jgi:glycosyltransferase involved in cell wall biosynthesis
MDAIVTNTRAVGESLRRIFSLGIPIENIPNGVHPSFFQRGERIVRPGKIIYVGQLYPWKGVGTLIAAMAHLPEGELHVVGGGREQVEALRGEARRSGVAERIVFHGQVSPAEVRELLGDAAVAVHPLTQKYPDGQFTSPLKLFEYMGAGVPIVAADLPATREILADEVNALLAPPDEPAALGAKIRRLLNDPDLRGRISRKAADDVLSFTWERRAERLLALFAKLGEPKGSKND